MCKRIHKVQLNTWIIVGISVALFVFGLFFRLYQLDHRLWFFGDHSHDLLYAINAATTNTPLLIGPGTSGSTLPNTPIFYNFLALLIKVSGLDIVIAIYLYICILTLVVPLFFIWGVIEDEPLSGFIAAFFYAIFPGAIDIANVWNPFFALVPGLMGLLFFRLAIKRQIRLYRIVALVALSLASVLHYSFFGLFLSIILYECIRTKSIIQMGIDIVISSISICLFMFSSFVLLILNNVLSISVFYSGETCRFCIQKIPSLLHEGASRFFWTLYLHPYTSLLVYIFIGSVAFISISIRKHLYAWGIYVSIFWLYFAWLFVGQLAFWYIYPFVFLVWYVFADILAKGLRCNKVYIKGLSIVACLIFVFLSLRSFGDLVDPASKIQEVVRIETQLKTTLRKIGVSDNQYVEYVNLRDDKEIGFPNTTAFWLIRQWKFHEELTYNNPLHEYDPALIHPTPPYRVVVCRACKSLVDSEHLWIEEGYVYEKKMFIGENLWMAIYKRIM